MQKQSKGIQLFALSTLFILLFNFPILSIINQVSFIGKIPTLYVGVFGLWIGFIILIYELLRWENKDSTS